MTGGLTFLSTPSPMSAALCAGLTAFGGLSITAQTMLFARQAGIPLRPYLVGRALTALFSAILCFAVFFVISGTY
jgi:ABC-type cobalamin transport system permease subunit